MIAHLGAVRVRRFLTIGLASFPTVPTLAATLAVPGSFPTIQAALDAATDGDEILVAPGTYAEAIDFLGKRVALRAVADAPTTVIDATGIGAPVVTIVDSPAGTVLERFTLRGGSGTSDGFSLRGGGLFLRDSSPTIIGCEITGNSAVGVTPANGSGGGAFIDGGATAFVRCAFKDNIAGRSGGALYATGASLIVSNCAFFSNTAGQGAAIYTLASDMTLVDSLVVKNESTSAGAISTNVSSTATITSCTIAFNQALSTDNIASSNSLIAFSNTIIWGANANVIASDNATLTYRACDIIGSGGSGPSWKAALGTDLGANLDADPRFVNPQGAFSTTDDTIDNFRLFDFSPCIDAGDNALLPPDIFDLDGDSDTIEQLPLDLALAARRVDDTGAPDTGAGVAPITDIGAIEFQGTSMFADFNGDTLINGVDLAFLLNNWGVCAIGSPCRGDLTGDGVVGAPDLAVLLKSWSPAAP